VTLNFKILKQLSKNLSILYVEDDVDLRERTATIFKNLFDIVDVAQDGKKGLNLYTQYFEKNAKYYDVVISDIQMPILDGIGLTKEIFKIYKQQKVIIISAYNDKEYLIELINIGVEAFLQKPLASDNMLEVLYNVCDSLNDENKVDLEDGFIYNKLSLALLKDSVKIELSDNESKLLQLLVENKNKSFNAINIFNHLYFNEPDKEFSSDSIKSLIKRLRKKLPQDTISNTQNLGYSINQD